MYSEKQSKQWLEVYEDFVLTSERRPDPVPFTEFEAAAIGGQPSVVEDFRSWVLDQAWRGENFRLHHGKLVSGINRVAIIVWETNPVGGELLDQATRDRFFG